MIMAWRADHAGAADLLELPVRVGDPPMPRLELHGFSALVGERDRIGPEEVAVLRRRAVRQVARRDLNFDTAGDGAIHDSLKAFLAMVGGRSGFHATQSSR
jgi:hypothetical protein